MSSKKRLKVSRPASRKTSLELDIGDILTADREMSFMSLLAAKGIKGSYELPTIGGSSGRYRFVLALTAQYKEDQYLLDCKLRGIAENATPSLIRGKVILGMDEDWSMGDQDQWKQVKNPPAEPTVKRSFYHYKIISSQLQISKRELESEKYKLYCQVELVEQELSLKIERQAEEDCNAISRECNRLERKLHVSRKIFDMMAAGTFADFVVKSGAKEIPCHRVVLAATSEVFEKMLQSGMREAQRGELRLDIVPEVMLEKLVDWMYGKIDEADVVDELEAVSDVLPVADQYQLHGLKRQCESVMRSSLAPETSLQIASLSTLFGLEKTHNCVVEFIADNYDKFIENEELLENLRKSTTLDNAVLRLLHANRRSISYT